MIIKPTSVINFKLAIARLSLFTWCHSSALVTTVASYKLATEAIRERRPVRRKPRREQRNITIVLIESKPPFEPNTTRILTVTTRLIPQTIRVVKAIVCATRKIVQLFEHITGEAILTCFTVEEPLAGAQVLRNVRHVDLEYGRREVVEKHAV